MDDFAKIPEKPRRGRRPSLLPPSPRAARNRVLAKYIKQAEQRSYVWALSPEDFDHLTSQNCHYCGQVPSNTARSKRSVFIYSGIDRMDNAYGYTLDNVVPSCKTCNLLKGRIHYTEFTAYLNRVSEFRRLKANAVSV